MPSYLILAVILASTVPSTPMLLAMAERGSTATVECVGKRRIVATPPRIKKETARKPCRVIAPILM